MFGAPNMLNRETSKPQKIGRTLARFGFYFRPYWAALLFVLLILIISTVSQVVTPLLMGQTVDCYLSPANPAQTNQPAATLQNGSSAGSTGCWYDSGAVNLAGPARLAGLAALILWIVGLFVLQSALAGLMFYTMSRVGQRVLRSLRDELFRHFHRLSIRFYNEHEVGDLMSRITNDTETIGQAFGFALVNVISGSLLIVAIAYTMLATNLPFALISLSIVPVMALTTNWFSSRARKAFRVTRKEMGSVNAELQESISAVREVQAFNRQQENIENFMQTNAANRDANVRAMLYTSALAPTLESLGYLSLAIVAGVGGYALLNGSSLFGTSITLGLVITYLAFVQRFNMPIQQISVLWTNIQSAIAGGERIFGLLDEVPDIQDAPDAVAISTIQGKVEFERVSAAYEQDQMVLDEVSFVAEPGQTVAIVGYTGAGKTTLINLIPRFYDVTGGAVLVDGLDVRFIQAESLRKQIGIVLQDTFMFSTTVMENIRYGRPEATDEEVMDAARLAHADTFIERLPQKYQTVLGERGSGLSQGQRQLLAIARAALADPRILILDEATSSVDTRTERLIQAALDKLLHGRTSFVIAHRLSTIRNADVVLVIDQGKIIERGRHEELLAKKSFYYNLYMSQFSRDPEFSGVLGGDGHKKEPTPTPLPPLSGHA